MIELLLNLTWGLAVLLSFTALGRLMARVVRPAGSWDIAMATAWGMAGMVALGGWLNLLGVARSSVLLALVLAVLLVDLLYERRNLLEIGEQDAPSPGEPTERGKWIWLGLLALLIAIKYTTSLGRYFNDNDDQPAYLLEVSRLLQTGSVGRDPFSERQLLSLNGQTFLLGLMGSVSPPKYAFLLDPGICWLMIAGLTWFLVRRDLRGSIRDACLWTGLVLMVKVPIAVNLGSHLTGAVLYLNLVRTALRGCGEKGGLDRGSLLLLACTVAALSALKTTFLYYAALFLLGWYGLRMWHSPRLILILVRELSLVGLVASALLLPWMWQQYLSSGTPLYPLLGTGYHQSGPGSEFFGDTVKNKAKAAIYFLANEQVAPAILGFLLLACNPWEDRARWRIVFASTFGILIGSVFLAFLMANNTIFRYTHPMLYAGMIPLGLFGFFSTRPSKAGTGLALCLAIFVGTQWENLHTSLAYLVDFVRSGRYGFLLQDQDAERIRNAQAAIPPGTRILASVQNGFLLDLSRNPTWSLDLPGMVSPPPGLPITTDPPALRDFLMRRTTALPSPCPSSQLLEYLQNFGIDFLVFQRGEGSTWYLRHSIPEKPFVGRVILATAQLVHAQLLELMSRCRRLYDDGDLVVLDLRTREESLDPRDRPNP